MNKLKLYMILLGCRPPGRFTEQHDIFFGIGESLNEIMPEILLFWPEAEGKLHIDAFRQVTYVDGYSVDVLKRNETIMADEGNPKLFFLNLGGYKKNEFEEFHYKTLVVADSQNQAIGLAKQTVFFKHTGFTGAPSHIDEKYGVDVDDIFPVSDILGRRFKEKYSLSIRKGDGQQDKIHLGYLPLNEVTTEL